MDVLSVYEPTAMQPWNRPRAMHLLRRAGFAAAEENIQQVLQAGPTATIDRLIDAPEQSEHFRDLDRVGERIAIRNNIELLRGWWLHRMQATSRPLHARMALFWHNHFATSNVKVADAALMLKQLRTFETHALGQLEPLLLAVSKDPAMIIWLDGNSNVKGRPNENYARELFELFGLGIGHYTEQDIQEAARAFTGWHQRNGTYKFASHAHDDRVKTILGTQHNFNGDDVIRLMLKQTSCAVFIATKLLKEFVSPQPSGKLINATAHHLRDNGYDLATTLRTLLKSRAFFDEQHYGVRIKSPVEHTIGILRSLEMNVPAEALARTTSQMGQCLFEPPSVKGWEGHRMWLNSASMLVRLNTVARALRHERFSADALISKYKLYDRKRLLAFCSNLTLDGSVPNTIMVRLESIQASGPELMREALRMLMSSPEYQLA